jgi:hypothetical protein
MVLRSWKSSGAKIMHNDPSGTSVNKPQSPNRVDVVHTSPDVSEHRKDNERIPPEE